MAEATEITSSGPAVSKRPFVEEPERGAAQSQQTERSFAFAHARRHGDRQAAPAIKRLARVTTSLEVRNSFSSCDDFAVDLAEETGRALEHEITIQHRLDFSMTEVEPFVRQQSAARAVSSRCRGLRTRPGGRGRDGHGPRDPHERDVIAERRVGRPAWQHERRVEPVRRTTPAILEVATQPIDIGTRPSIRRFRGAT